MSTSIFLAQALGIYFIVMGLMMFRGSLTDIVSSYAKNEALRFVTGIFTLILGILFVLSHNVWEGESWQIFITVIAWITLIKGLIYVLFPKSIYSIAMRFFKNKHTFKIWGVILLVLGVWLCLNGF